MFGSITAIILAASTLLSTSGLLSEEECLTYSVSSSESDVYPILVETAKHIVPPEKYVWNWRDAIVLKAMTDIYDSHPEARDEIIEWMVASMNSIYGKAHGRHPNAVASGAGFAFLNRVLTDYSSDNSTENDSETARIAGYHYTNFSHTGNSAGNSRTNDSNANSLSFYYAKAEMVYEQYCRIPRFDGATHTVPAESNFGMTACICSPCF